MAWSEERIDTLKALFGKGLSYSQIAKRLGVTRAAVGGVIHRLGLGRYDTGQAQVHGGRTSARKRNPKRLTFGAASSRARPKRAPEEPHTQPPVLTPHPETMKRVPLLERKANECAWPLWNDGDDHRDTCGNKTHGSSSYCAHHARVSMTVPRKRWAKDDPRRFRFAEKTRKQFGFGGSAA